MSLPMPDVIVVALLSIFFFVALCGALVLIVISMRRPTTLPLAIAAGLVLLCLAVAAVSPVNIPALMGLILVLLGTAIAVVGGNPLTRRVLTIATHGRVRDGDLGGIIVDEQSPDEIARRDAEPEGEHEVMRGGTTIGYLERLSVVVAIIAGFPEAIAIVVAVKGVGRFSELAAAEARERFIIGTLTSLLWACILGALVRLAIW